MRAASLFCSGAALLSIFGGVGVAAFNIPFFDSQKAYTRQLGGGLTLILYLAVGAGVCGLVSALIGLIGFAVLIVSPKKTSVIGLFVASALLSACAGAAELVVVMGTQMGPIGAKYHFPIKTPMYSGEVADIFVPAVAPKSHVCDSSSDLVKWIDGFDAKWEESFKGVSFITRILYENVYGMFISAVPSALTGFCYTFDNGTWVVKDPKGSVIIDWNNSTFPEGFSEMSECEKINIVLHEYVGGWGPAEATDAIKKFCRYIVEQGQFVPPTDEAGLSDLIVKDAKKAREDYTAGTYGLLVANSIFVSVHGVVLILALSGVVLACFTGKELTKDEWQMVTD